MRFRAIARPPYCTLDERLGSSEIQRPSLGLDSSKGSRPASAPSSSSFVSLFVSIQPPRSRPSKNGLNWSKLRAGPNSSRMWPFEWDRFCPIRFKRERARGRHPLHLFAGRRARLPTDASLEPCELSGVAAGQWSKVDGRLSIVVAIQLKLGPPIQTSPTESLGHACFSQCPCFSLAGPHFWAPIRLDPIIRWPTLTSKTLQIDTMRK